MIVRPSRVAGVCVLVVLTSCGGEDESATPPGETPSPAATQAAASPTAESSPTEPPTPDPTPSPSVDPPVEPPNAHEYSVEGVEAFTQYAIDVINYIYLADDISYLEEIMTSDCVACGNWIEDFDSRREAGIKIEGGLMLASSMDTPGPVDDMEVTSVAVDLVFTASQTMDRNGEVSNNEPELNAQVIFDHVREAGRWKLENVRLGESQPS